ncbi:Alpha/beta hydrolase family protein [Posidoniimonas polymericola]|uniref:Alpha/beta hydrolase family protein n=1 Tax=Posidoniimonas polymericola TaxID=2528002 RepID=A0A5C5ZFA5_9BACT|nr:Alpha/beta hydrolase family protein [Posidoniimonas polymericola]
MLIHGIGSTRWLLWPLARRLQRAGYATRLWGYFSLLGSNRQIGRRLAGHLRRLAESGEYGRVHIVAHSMGGIATRCALAEFEQLGERTPHLLGRIVMVGTPNRGSHTATQLTRLHGRLSPTLYELRDTPDSFVNNLPAPPEHVEIGVIATRADRVVALDATHLPGQRDHCLVEGMHTGALWTPECAGQVEHFLRHGEFHRADAPARLTERAVLS